MGTGGEEPLQGAAGTTQVRVHGHHCDRETFYTHRLDFLWVSLLGAGFGWPVEEEDVVSRTDI